MQQTAIRQQAAEAESSSLVAALEIAAGNQGQLLRLTLFFLSVGFQLQLGAPSSQQSNNGYK